MDTAIIFERDLPLWMRKARRSADWGVLLALIFSLFTVLPFMTQPGLPQTNANENHAFRTADYAQALREGYWFPRWAAAAFEGYGAPIHHYYPPATAYIGALLQLIVTDNPVDAVRFLYIVSFPLIGCGVYVLISGRMGAQAGLLGSLLVVNSPYLGLSAPYLMGDQPLIFGMTWLIGVLWAAGRWLTRGATLDPLLVAVTYAALLLTHPGLAVAAIPLILVFALTQTKRPSYACWRGLILSLLLGAGAAAGYWLPALAEYDASVWLPAREVPAALRLDQVFSPVRPIDPMLLRPQPQISLGLPLIGLALIGLAAAWRQRPRASLPFASAILAALGILIGTLPGGAWLLAPATLCAAVCAGSSLNWALALPKSARHLFLPILVILTIVINLPTYLPPRWETALLAASTTAQITYEQQGYGIAVLPPDAPIPTNLRADVKADIGLRNGYLTGRVNKIPQQALIDVAEVGVILHTSHSDVFQVTVARPAVIPILTTYFPGWVARLDGRPITYQRDEATGLSNVVFTTSALGELRVSLESTPIRTFAWLITWSSAACLVVWSLRRRKLPNDDLDNTRLLTAETRLTGVVALCCGFCLIALQLAPSAALSSVFASNPPSAVSLNAATEVGLTALRYRLPQRTFTYGDTVRLEVDWMVTNTPTANYQVRLLLLNLTTGGRWLPTTPTHPSGYPTQRWLPNRYATHVFTIPVNRDLPVGDYAPAVETLACTGVCTLSNRLNWFSANGEALGSMLVLPEIITIQP